MQGCRPVSVYLTLVSCGSAILYYISNPILEVAEREIYFPSVSKTIQKQWAAELVLPLVLQPATTFATYNLIGRCSSHGHPFVLRVYELSVIAYVLDV
jgi:hypothetical protein